MTNIPDYTIMALIIHQKHRGGMKNCEKNDFGGITANSLVSSKTVNSLYITNASGDIQVCFAV